MYKWASALVFSKQSRVSVLRPFVTIRSCGAFIDYFFYHEDAEGYEDLFLLVPFEIIKSCST